MFKLNLLCALTIVSAACLSLAADNPDAPPLKLVQTVPLDGVEGRIDHFAWDAKGSRLFLAALGNNTVEVIDVRAGKVAQHITGLSTPQGVAFAPDVNRLAVANDKDGSVQLYDGTTLKQIKKTELGDDADNVRYDEAAKRFYVGYGDGGIAGIDAEKGTKLADVKLDGHPESFQLEKNGPRIFVNVPGARHVAVIDRNAGKVIATWPVKEAASNFPMALDENHKRLFVGCRNPATLLVLDTDNGNTVAVLDCVADVDDVFYNAMTNQIYVSGGGGTVSVFKQTDSNKYALAATIPTAPGARTSFLVAELNMLFVAVPKRDSQQAELLVFTLETAK